DLSAAGHQDATRRHGTVSAHARTRVPDMSTGSVRPDGWRRAIAGALLMLFGCSHVPTEPTRGTPPRGKQEGPLPGVPEEQPWVEAAVPPPPYPKDSDLVEFYLRGQTT